MHIQVAVRGPKVQVCAVEVVVCDSQAAVCRIQPSPQSGRMIVAQPFMAGYQERKNLESAQRTAANSPAIYRWVSNAKGS